MKFKVSFSKLKMQNIETLKVLGWSKLLSESCLHKGECVYETLYKHSH